MIGLYRIRWIMMYFVITLVISIPLMVWVNPIFAIIVVWKALAIALLIWWGWGEPKYKEVE